MSLAHYEQAVKPSGHARQKRPWYKRYGADFVFGTMDLTLEERGAYTVCLDLIYERGGAIPDDARWLAGMMRVSLRKWASLRARLIAIGKLVEIGDVLTNRRADHELRDATEQSDADAENGAKGGRKRAENALKTVCKSDQTVLDPNKNSDLGQARLKPSQKLDTRYQNRTPSEDKSSSGGGSPKRARPKVSIPERWEPSEIDRAYASKAGFSPVKVDLMAEKFVNHALQNDRKCSDWQAAWRNWVLKEVERQAPPPAPKRKEVDWC